MNKVFEEIQNKAIAEWEALQNDPRPKILVGAGTCGSAAGASDILEAIKGELAQQNIEAILIKVGCLGPCYAEPMIGIIKKKRSQIIYANLTPGTTTQLIRDYLLNDNPRSDLAFGYIGNVSIDGIP